MEQISHQPCSTSTYRPISSLPFLRRPNVFSGCTGPGARRSSPRIQHQFYRDWGAGRGPRNGPWRIHADLWTTRRPYFVPPVASSRFSLRRDWSTDCCSRTKCVGLGRGCCGGRCGIWIRRTKRPSSRSAPDPKTKSSTQPGTTYLRWHAWRVHCACGCGCYRECIRLEGRIHSRWTGSHRGCRAGRL